MQKDKGRRVKAEGKRPKVKGMMRGRRQKGKARLLLHPSRREGFWQSTKDSRSHDRSCPSSLSPLYNAQRTSPTPRGVHEEYDCVWSKCGKLVSLAHQQERSRVVSVGLPAAKHSYQRSTGSCGLVGQTGACPGLQGQQGPTQELLMPYALHIQQALLQL